MVRKMEFQDKLNNLLVDISNLFRAYGYIIFPTITSIICFILLKFDVVIYPDICMVDNMVNISGIFSGFLFTTIGILLALPDTKFKEILIKHGYLYAIYKMMFLAMILLMIAMLVGIFQLAIDIFMVVFIAGLTEMVNAMYFFYQIASLFAKESNL